MTTLCCFQCPISLDCTSREIALEEAHRHAQAYGHNVGLYASSSLEAGEKREMVAIVLKWRRRAA